jgi:hypothetical protein
MPISRTELPGFKSSRKHGSIYYFTFPFHQNCCRRFVRNAGKKSQTEFMPSSDLKSFRVAGLIAADGELLRERGLLGMRLEKTAREEAIKGIGTAAGEDLAELASVASRRDGTPAGQNRRRSDGWPSAEGRTPEFCRRHSDRAP